MTKPVETKLSPHEKRALVASKPDCAAHDTVNTAYKRIDSELLESGLEGFALTWLKSLPTAVKPLKCARHYPRVLNKVAALWGLNERCMEWLNELLVDTRGTRAGFSYGVTAELRRLKSYRISLLPREASHSGFSPTEPMPLDRFPSER